MRVYKEEQLDIPASVVTIGAFDGLHVGHQALINQTVESANSLGIPSVVYTFDPPPRSMFQGKRILTTATEKIDLLQAYGVDYAIMASFNKAYASRPAREFIRELEHLHPKEVIVGPNFTFGKNKVGNINFLAEYYNVTVQPFVRCKHGEIISSTRIRTLIANNELENAEHLLNGSYTEKIKL